MSVFDDIRLEWHGREYVVRSNKVMGAIARIEDVLTLTELQQFAERNTAPLAKIAMAYGAVLRYAGARVEDDEVYEGLFSSGTDSAEVIMASLQTLLTMMVPPSALVANANGTGAPPKGESRKTAARSSKKPTKRRSASGA